MSSILYNPNRKDYLRPSKTLQDLKAKLGKVYIDAKLIECPQNAFELSRLQKTIEQLDKQKYRRLAEANREQRILYNSLSPNFVTDASISNLADPVVVEMVDNKLPPPGFRFHSDGKPKLEYLPKSDIARPSSLEMDSQFEVGMSSHLGVRMSSPPNQSNVGFGFSELAYERPASPRIRLAEDDRYSAQSGNSRPSTPRGESINARSRIVKTPSIAYNEVDYAQEIETLEKLIKQLKNDISTKKSQDSIEVKHLNLKHSYLRAHSRTDEPEINKHKLAVNAAMYRPISSTDNVAMNTKQFHRSKCVACQMKMKHVYNEEKLKHKKNPLDLKTRWQVAPRGTYVQSPSTMNTRSRAMSAPTLNLSYKKIRDQAESEHILKTYIIPTTDSETPTNTRAVSAQYMGSPSMGSNLRPGCRSSLRRFTSPTERESQLQAFKSRANIECQNVSMKVEDFLQQFKCDNEEKKHKADKKKYYFLNENPNDKHSFKINS